MRELDKQYPEYGFAKHKGYGTKQHLKALEQHGTTPHHRLTRRTPNGC
jgi:ribonuclease HII